MTTNPNPDRRERYAAAIADGFRAFDADTTSDAYLDAELLDAVVAVADAEQAELRAVVARLTQMTDHWEQKLPEVIRTPAVVSAIRAALEPVSSAVSVVPPATNQTALREQVAGAIREFPFDDFGLDDVSYLLEGEPDTQEWVPKLADAVLAVLPAPVDRATTFREAAEALGRMDYDTDSHDYGYDTYRDAWNGGVMDGADLLRRLAAEAPHTATPDEAPAETECAHCWRLVENRGTPSMDGNHSVHWVHVPGGFTPCFPQRGADSPHAEPRAVDEDAPPKEPHPTEADLRHALAVFARFQGRDTAEPAAPETVHACPPDGSGLTPCCGRTPFELPRTDRISSEAAAITCAPAVVAQPGKEPS